MQTLIRHIEYLISRSDCVIIPDLGAILAHREHAAYDGDSETYAPPRRSYAFNGALTHSDGMLAHSVARAEGVSYDIASQMVGEGVGELKSRLHSMCIMPLGRIGIMRYDQESDTISFSPFAYDCLGIGTAHLPELHVRETRVEVPAYVEPLQPVETPRIRGRWHQAVRVAASLAILIFICFVASTPIIIDDAALASLSPEIRQTSIEQIIPARPEPTYIVASTAHPEGVYIDVDEANFAQARYLLVIGSFRNQADADLYIQQMGDPTLKVYVSDDKYRIYASAHATEADAYRHVGTTQARYPNVWVCRK